MHDMVSHLRSLWEKVHRTITYRVGSGVRPPLNKKLFPVHRPGGVKRELELIFLYLKKKNFFVYFPPPVHSSV